MTIEVAIKINDGEIEMKDRYDKPLIMEVNALLFAIEKLKHKLLFADKDENYNFVLRDYNGDHKIE